MHLSVVLNGIPDREFSVRGAKENLWLVPLSNVYMGKAAQQGFILGFGSTSVAKYSPRSTNCGPWDTPGISRRISTSNRRRCRDPGGA